MRFKKFVMILQHMQINPLAGSEHIKSSVIWHKCVYFCNVTLQHFSTTPLKSVIIIITIITKNTRKVQTSADAKISTESNPEFESGCSD